MGQTQYQQPNQQPQKPEQQETEKEQAVGQEAVVPREIERIYPSAERGLTSAQAAELAANGYTNVAVASNAKTTGQIIKENTFTFFNMVFVVLAILLIVAESYKDMAFLLIAAANSLIGIIQQLRSRATLEKLNLLAEGRVKVVRDGRLGTVSVHNLVREDIAELGAGDQIPADGPVLSGQVTVNEALITGEADPITKNPGDELLSGSFVISGKCRARMEHVGADSYASRLALEAKADRGAARSGMMKSMDRLIKVIGFALIPIGIALFCNSYIRLDKTFSSSIEAMVAALVGMIPEGLYLLTSVALAVSVMRLAQKKTLVHEMSAIETLARVDVLCVDKTGTITLPEMSVRDVVCLDEELYPQSRVEELLNGFYRSVEIDNDTAQAMAKRFAQPSRMKAEKVIPFTSENKWSAVTFRSGGSFVIGAPEFVLGSDYEGLRPLVTPYQAEGCRVLLLGHCTAPPTARSLNGPVEAVALITLNNPIRPEAKDTFEYFARHGVAVKVISGDNPETVSSVALQAGIADAERYVDASYLHEGVDYAQAVRDYTVFGRVTPDQKRKLVKALQREGHTVAMTGDGVNDVLALKDADCGIAMASGSEAACQVAELVLLNSDFSALPSVVEEGRRVINNIQRSAALYLVKNIMSFFLSLITVFAGFPYPFVGIQVTLISALTIGIPSFVLALEPNHELVRGRFMPNVLRRALPGGLTNIVLIVGIELFTLAFTFEHTTLSTLATVLMGFVGLLVLYYISRPLDWKRWTLLGAMTVAFLLAVLIFGSFFELSRLDFQSWLVIVVFLMLAPSVIYVFEKGFEKFWVFLENKVFTRAARKRRKV